MSEYVVRWKHWRRCEEIDHWVKQAKLHRWSWANATPSNMEEWYLDGNEVRRHKWPVSQHGGKTECRIYQRLSQNEIDKEFEHNSVVCTDHIVAHAEAVCSWRDQFDRRVGRLYSLALALCEIDLDISTRRQLLLQNGAHAWEWDGKFVKLDTAIAAKDKSAVKRICAEIVQSWKRR